jgi:hypothetical protein
MFQLLIIGPCTGRLTKCSISAVPNLGAMDIFQGVFELGWENKNYNFIFTNLKLKFIFSFNNKCMQRSNLWTVRFKKCF